MDYEPANRFPSYDSPRAKNVKHLGFAYMIKLQLSRLTWQFIRIRRSAVATFMRLLARIESFFQEA